MPKLEVEIEFGAMSDVGQDPNHIQVDGCKGCVLHVCPSYCITSTFSINGVAADMDDFGAGVDDAYNIAYESDAHCNNRVFEPIDNPVDIAAIQNKYGLSAEEYAAVSSALVEALSFGECDLCS